jgi:hypothetical protein
MLFLEITHVVDYIVAHILYAVPQALLLLKDGKFINFLVFFVYLSHLTGFSGILPLVGEV